MTISIYDKYGNSQSPAPQASGVHGMTGAQVDELHQRFASFMPSLAHAGGGHSSFQNLFKDDLPNGANWDRTAQVSPTMQGGSGGRQLTTVQTPYQPEFACGIYGTLISMADGSHKEIQNIVVGDRILDKNGNIQVVERQWCDGTPDKVIEIKLSGGETLNFTQEHAFPVWAWLRKCLCGCGNSVEPGRCYSEGIEHFNNAPNIQLIKVDGGKLPYRQRRIPADYQPMQRMIAADIKQHDFLVIPRKFDAVQTNITSDVARLLGYYVAEGCEGNYGLHFALCIDEVDTLAADIVDIAYKNFNVVMNIGLREDTNACVVRSQTNAIKPVQYWLAANGGKGALTKRLSEEVMRWPLELKVELLKGMYLGDGYQGWAECESGSKTSIDKDKKYTSHKFFVNYTTISKTLAYQTQLLLAQLGVYARVTKVKECKKLWANRDGSVIERTSKVAYRLVSYGTHAMKIADMFWGASSRANEHIIKTQREKYRVDDNYIYIPVKSVSLVPNDKPVYNLTVSGDHSYLAYNIGTYNSPDRQQYPVHRILANRYWRLFYKLDPVIGNCVDLYGDLPWSNFELTGEGIEGEIRQAYEYMCRETQVLALLPHFIREFLVVGEVIPHLFFDNERGVFTYIALHNPDQIEVTDAPFIKMDPVLEFIPDDRLRAVLTSDQPALRRIRETMPNELINRLNARQNIPLSSVNATFIPRKLHPYDTRGTSIVSRMWRVLMLEDAVFNAQIQIARRHAGPLKVAKLGNAQTGWIPPPEQEKRLLELLAQAELDPNAWLVYHYGIQFDMVGTTDKVLSVNREWDTIERIKLIAMGVSKSFLHGEVTYSSSATGLQIFMQRLKVMRMFFEQKWLYPKFFRPVAEINGWIKPKPAQVAHHFKVRRSSKELEEQNAYLLPKVIWDKSLDPQVNSELIAAMTALESLGVKFSKTTKMAAVGYSYEEETKKIQREHQFEKQFLPVLPGKSDEGAGGGGGGLGGGGGPPPEKPDMDEDKAQTPPGLGGEVPPGVNAPPAPPKPPGAAIEVKGDEGEEPKDTKPSKSSHDNLKSEIWDNDKFGNWDAEEISDLIALLETGESNSAFWHQLSINGEFKQVALSGDPELIWGSIDNYLIAHNYPESDINELRHILEQEKWLVPSENKQVLDNIEMSLPDDAESMSDEQFASLVAREIKKGSNKIKSDNTHLLVGLGGSDKTNLIGDISDLMNRKNNHV